MRILIVGAGVAGLTLAALLRRQGNAPVVIDRRPEDADLGYALALWPHGTRVLHALDVHGAFVAESEPMSRYSPHDGSGRTIGSYDMQASIGRLGDLGTIPRPDFIALLERALGGSKVRTGVSVDHLSQRDDRVDVRLTDGSEASFDLVVGADGMHSRVRELLFGRIAEYDSGWGCFAWWGDLRLTSRGETREWWGAGSFLGMYPCRDRLCIIAGAPVSVLRPHEARGRRDRLRALFAPTHLPLDDLLAGLPGDTEPLFLWRMADVRAPHWTQGRVVLVGDAAAGFLPTAGIGASMALESAAVLADELSRTDAAHLPYALDLYVKRRRKRVEAAQNQSRRLARLVFVRSHVLCRLRDQLMRFVTLEQVTGPLIKQFEEPI